MHADNTMSSFRVPKQPVLGRLVHRLFGLVAGVSYSHLQQLEGQFERGDLSGIAAVGNAISAANRAVVSHPLNQVSVSVQSATDGTPDSVSFELPFGCLVLLRDHAAGQLRARVSGRRGLDVGARLQLWTTVASVFREPPTQVARELLDVTEEFFRLRGMPR